MAGNGAVIFDLDGTLADSERAHEAALLAAAAGRGLRLSGEEFRERCIGLGEEACFRMLASEQGVGLSAEAMSSLVAAKLARFVRAVGEGGVRGYPGAVELVIEVSGAAPVGVCSGSSRGSVDPMIAALGVGRHLGAVVTSSDVVRAKPDPAGYLLAAERLGAHARACVAVEDSPTGIAAARAAGMRVVAVEHSFGGARLRGADAVVPRIADIRAPMLLAMIG